MTSVRRYCSKHPVTASRHESTSDIAEALRVMRSAGIRRLPVTGASGTLVGLLSFDDLLDYYEQLFGDLGALLEQERRHERSNLDLPKATAGDR